MILEKIVIGEGIEIYKGNVGVFNKFNKEEFIKKIKYLQYLYPDLAKKHTHLTPGLQFPFLANLEEFNFVIDTIKKSLKKEIDTTEECILQSWVYISDNKNKYNGFHTHEKIPYYSGIGNTGNFFTLDTTITFTYYLQIPNNLKGDDCYLYFKTKEGKQIGFLPKEDEVWLFPPNLEHNVKPNLSSTNERIVIGSNVYFFDFNDIKIKKSLL